MHAFSISRGLALSFRPAEQLWGYVDSWHTPGKPRCLKKVWDLLSGLCSFFDSLSAASPSRIGIMGRLGYGTVGVGSVVAVFLASCFSYDVEGFVIPAPNSARAWSGRAGVVGRGAVRARVPTRGLEVAAGGSTVDSSSVAEEDGKRVGQIEAFTNKVCLSRPKDMLKKYALCVSCGCFAARHHALIGRSHALRGRCFGVAGHPGFLRLLLLVIQTQSRHDCVRRVQ